VTGRAYRFARGIELPSDGDASRPRNNPLPSSRHTNKPQRTPRSLRLEAEGAMLHADAISALHREPASVIYATVPSYEHLVDALNRRRTALNVSMKTLAEAASLQPGFVSSALGPSRTRRFGYLSLPLLLAPLGLRLGLIEAPELAARYTNELEKSNSNQARNNNYAARSGKRIRSRVFREFAALGRKTYATATAPELRKAIARHAALKRWYPDRAYDWNEIKKANVDQGKERA
jgi:hypothetical protein